MHLANNKTLLDLIFFKRGQSEDPQIDYDFSLVASPRAIWNKGFFAFFKSASGPQFKKLGLFATFKIPLEFAAVACLSPLIESFSQGRSMDCLFWICLLVLGLAAHGINQNHYFHIEALIMNSIERESLFYIFGAKKKNKLHQATHDVPILTYLPIMAAETYACTGIIAFGIFLLFLQIGKASFVAVVLIFLVSPVAAKLGSMVESLSNDLAANRSERVKYLLNLFAAIPILKTFNDMSHYINGLVQVRQKEESSKRSFILSVILPKLIFYFSSAFVYLATFAAYLWLGGKIDIKTVFSSFLILKIIDHPISSISELTVSWARARASFRRLSQFDSISEQDLLKASLENNGLRITTKQIEFTISQQQPAALIGPTGSGKSYFADQLFESLTILKKTHLVSQNPLILNGTIRDNICLGEQISDEKLNSILELAQITSKEFGENPASKVLTDNGANISGGQKQRIALARALNSNSEVLIFDDALSSLDIKTREKIFANVSEYTVGKKYVIWITNVQKEVATCQPILQINQWQVQKVLNLESCSGFLLQSAAIAETLPQESLALPATPDLKNASPENFVQNEKYFWKTLWLYFKSFNSSKVFPWEFSLIVCISILCLVIGNLQNNWLQIWANGDASGSALASTFKSWIDQWPIDLHLNLAGLAVFSGLAFVSFCFTTLRLVFWELISIRASSRNLRKAVEGLFYSSVIADLRIDSRDLTQRLSDDFTILDDRAQSGIEESFSGLLDYLIAATTVFLFSIKFALLYFVFFLLWTHFFRKFLVSNARLRKKSIQNKGIWLGQLNAWGASERQIVLAGADQFMAKDLERSLNRYQGTQLQINAVKRWFLGLSPILGSVLLLSILTVIFATSEFTALAGLVVTFSVQQWMQLNVLARSLDEVQTYSLSMKRIFELNAERDPKIFSPVMINPKTPQIELRKLAYGYEYPIVRTEQIILKYDQIAIVHGRTGAGKSTLIKGLIGMCRHFEGDILVDGIRLEKGQSLLSASCYVSQDPVFLRPTLRQELQLVHLSDVEQIRQQLAQVGLSRYADTLDIELNQLSLGEQQLLCAVRAANSQKPILIFDEVTSKLDSLSEQKILEYLKLIKKTKIVILVSHREQTQNIGELFIRVEDGKAVSGSEQVSQKSSATEFLTPPT